MTLDLVQKVSQFCHRHALLARQDSIVIGVSGGPDSLGLLHLLKTLRPEFEFTLTVAHLNHQLRAEDAQADEAFVRATAARWQLPIFVETYQVAALAAERRQSLEEAARQIRYAFLWRVAQEVAATKIAVGHHADDQVETVLMHFLRGAGLAGLRGMLPIMDIANLHLHADDLPVPALRPSPKLIRPLLEISRPEIEAYCQAHQLAPRQDASNQDTTLFRNRLRHELIPLLETYNPQLRSVLQHTAKVVAAEVEVLNDQLDQAWRLIVKHASSEKVEIDWSGWLSLPLALKRSTLRRAIQTLRRSLRDINFEHIETVVALVEKGGVGTKATLPQGLILTMGYQIFTLAAENVPAYLPTPSSGPHLWPDQLVTLNLPGVTPLPGSNWQLKADFVSGSSLSQQRLSHVDRWEAYLDAAATGQTAVLRPRRPGDTFHPLGLGGHSQKVSEFMINEKIPADWRDHIPLFVAGDQVLWICGYRLDERARLQPATQRILHLKFERQDD